ncbi:alpha/beta hydrolase [soil metagenome]
MNGQTSPDGGARHIVLIHGAWQGSWAFAAWRPMLAAHGWQVHTIDLPGNGWPPAADAPANLDSYTAHVSSALRALDAPAIVVGHSGGGITASQVAEAVPERVAGLVYLAGMMLPSGMSFIDLIADTAALTPGVDLAGISPWLDHSADGLFTQVRTDGALRCFLQDCDPDAARAAAALLRPQQESGRAMRNQLSAARFGRVPRVYVECLDDQSVLLPLQRRMQQLSPGAQRISLDCGHVPQLAQPAQLTSLLLPVIETFMRQQAQVR